MSDSAGPESAAQSETRHLHDRGQVLLERGRALDRESRSFDFRSAALDEREDALGARRAALNERGAAIDRDYGDRTMRWPPGDERATEYARRHIELGVRDDRNRERAERLRAEEQAIVDRAGDDDPRMFDIEMRKYRLQRDELLDAVAETTNDYLALHNDLLAHVRDDSVWDLVGAGDAESTAAWREEMAAWMLLEIDLVEDRQQFVSDHKELARSRERLQLDVERNQIERDKLSADIDAFYGDQADWFREFAKSYEIDKSVRQRWMRDIGRRTERVTSPVWGTMFELFCAELLEQMGFDEVKWQGGTNDAGVDIWADEASYSSDITKLAVQCKFKGEHGSVGESDVMVFHGKLSMADRYHRAVVMTFGRIEKGAREFGEKNGVEFWDGQRLCEEMALKKLGLQFAHGPSGHELEIDEEWWDELLARAQAEHEKRKKG